ALDAVEERLQQTEGAGLVRAGALGHPGHDAALEPDAEHGADRAEDEGAEDLDKDQPPRVVTEVGERGVLGQWVHHAPASRVAVTVTTAPAPTPNVARTGAPG